MARPTPAVVHYTELDGSRKLLAQDALLREAPALQSEITDNPVERGAPVSDNIRLKADTLTLELLISNTPIAAPQSHANGATGAFTSTDGGGVVLQFSQEFDRIKAVKADLARVQTLGLMFDIQTSLGDYTDFAIEQCQVERTDKSGSGSKFVLTMKRVRYVDTQAAAIPRRIPRVRQPVPQGVQPPVAARETLAHRLLNEAGLLPSSE